ncbi:TetR-like C-terminal domain-containing protein [Streptomyces sp. NPDC101178]|uniref:TetR-like C-terminal domain-containing protein n=1 Tax=Streptomyces sp. NPDC101178 TaxID=3366124 RepID=UPI00381213AA
MERTHQGPRARRYRVQTRAAKSSRARLHDLAGAYRAWAIARPHRQVLIQGDPVAGYAAPADTLERARAVLGPFLPLLAAKNPGPADGSVSLEPAGRFAGMAHRGSTPLGAHMDLPADAFGLERARSRAASRGTPSAPPYDNRSPALLSPPPTPPPAGRGCGPRRRGTPGGPASRCSHARRAARPR